MTETGDNLYVALYDLSVGDWDGEMDFYHAWARQAHAQGQAVLEIACGTGRVAIRLAQAGVVVTGLDHSAAMLDIARAKSTEMSNLRWVQADMRDFELEALFGLAIIPGHAFQNINTAEDQAACLISIRRHLTDNGVLIVHLDRPAEDWLGDIGQHPFETIDYGEKLVHPVTGQICRSAYSWGYERATQTAIYRNTWEILDANDVVIERHDEPPRRLQCVFRNEMEHAARRAGFVVEALYGDFHRSPLQDDSESMIWVLRNEG